MATREYHRNYYHNVLKPKMLAYVGGDNPVCAVCGSSESLEFDHIDPDSKSFNIAKNPTVSNAAVRAELDKCQLLCSPCHKAKSVLESKKRREGTFTHGTLYAWSKKKCSCDECATAKRDWNNARNELRRTGGARVRGPYRRSDEPMLCGEVRTYRNGCRCDACRAANAKRARELYAAKRKA